MVLYSGKTMMARANATRERATLVASKVKGGSCKGDGKGGSGKGDDDVGRRVKVKSKYCTYLYCTV